MKPLTWWILLRKHAGSAFYGLLVYMFSTQYCYSLSFVSYPRFANLFGLIWLYLHAEVPRDFRWCPSGSSSVNLNNFFSVAETFIMLVLDFIRSSMVYLPKFHLSLRDFPKNAYSAVPLIIQSYRQNIVIEMSAQDEKQLIDQDNVKGSTAIPISLHLKNSHIGEFRR